MGWCPYFLHVRLYGAPTASLRTCVAYILKEAHSSVLAGFAYVYMVRLLPLKELVFRMSLKRHSLSSTSRSRPHTLVA